MVEPGHQDQILQAGQTFVDGGVLAGQSHDLAGFPRIGQHVDTGNSGGARVRGQQRGQHPHGGGLARTVGAEQPEHGASGYLEAHPLERLYATFERLDQRIDDNGRTSSHAGKIP